MIPSVFRIRSFRFQFFADLLTSWAFEMETLILGWYVIVQTGSVLLLTVFASLQFLGTLAAPMFGVLADRLGCRVMLCAMRAVYASLAAVLMLLAVAGVLAPAWVLLVAALAGLVRPNDQAMRNALIGETIPPGHLVGALGISRATQDSARVAGALAGAGLSAALGVGLAYAFVTLFYLGSLALTFGVARRLPVPDPAADAVGAPRALARPSRWRDLKDGFAHVLATPKLLGVLWLAFLVNLTAYPVTSGLLPYVARRVYMVDATGLGWLVASFSFGALLGSIAMIATGGARRPERTMLVQTVVWYVLLLGFGYTQTMGAGMVVLVIAGFTQSVAMISMAATLLVAAGERFRARVMGVRTLAVYGMTPGLLGAGALVESIGYPATITLFCAIGILVTLAIGIRWRASIWQAREEMAAVTASLPGQVR